MSFTDNSINFFGFDIYYYGIAIVLGMLVALYVTAKLMKKMNMKVDNMYTYAIFVIPSAVLGARLYYFLFSEHEMDWSRFFAVRDGGLGIYGGIIVGLVTLILVSIIIKDDLIKMVDVTAPGVMIAQAIGRWGNFFNGEAHGNLVTDPNLQWFPYAVEITSGDNSLPSGWYQATFFYESLWNIIGFILFIFLFRLLTKRGYRKGVMFCFYPIWYGIGRFWIEQLRTDSLYLLGMKVSVLVSAVGVIAGLAGMLYIYRYEVANFFLKLMKKPLLVRPIKSAEEPEADSGEQSE